MITINVTPVIYKSERMKHYRHGIQILNRRTNTFTLIDIKTLQKVDNAAKVVIISLVCSVGNVYFNFKS